MLSLQPMLLVAALSATSQVELLEFTAEWCGPCKTMQPVVRQIEAAGTKVHTIDIDRSPEVAARFQVTQVPTFVVISGGQPVDRLVGAVPGEQLISMLQRHRSPTAAGPRPTAAAAHSPPPGRAATPSTSSIEQLALAASARLQVRDARGRSFGTGTVVDVHDGEALLLTCAHLFRDSNGQGEIAVELFAPGAEKSVRGELIRFDLERDVALVAVRTRARIRPAVVADDRFQISPNEPVFSVGCNHGQDVTVLRGQVLAVNKYLGPENIVASGRPVDGRSGGGLFSADGRLVGICNAADPDANEGIYAAFKSIHRMLDEANLAFVYRGRDSEPARAVAAAEDRAVRPATFEQQALQALDREDAEVICIIRSRTRPDDRSQVIVLDRPSREFMAKLTREHRDQSQRQLTGMRIEDAPPVPNAPVQRAPQRRLPR